MSLPWIHLKSIRIRDSKYGIALVLDTSEFAGQYVLGFRVDNIEAMFDELSSLFESYR